MSTPPNPPSSNDPQKQNNDALNALENFASGRSPAPARSDDSVDASGFVGMLARGNAGEADPAGTGKPPPAMRRPMPQVSPKANPQSAPKTNPLSGAIHVAKEIVPEQTSPPAAEPAAEVASEMTTEQPVEEPFAHETSETSEPVEPRDELPEQAAAPAPRAQSNRGQQTRRVRRQVPQWYHTAVPISFTMGAILMVLGVWALIAILSKATGSAMAPGFDPKEDGIVMPIVLVLSLPVGIALEIMAVIMRKQLKAQSYYDSQ